jgi:two-component system nitrate/nitrite response regulator NarL
VRLVLCDEHRLLVEALADALSDAGHEVSAVTRLDQLPAMVERRRPDAVLLEASYGGVSRLDAVAVVRVRHPSTTVVLVTGAAPQAVWRAYDAQDVDAVVSKSCSLEAVESTVMAARRGRRPVTGFRRPVPMQRPHPMEVLTGREREVLDLLVKGLSTSLIASRLGVSTNTVRSHVAAVLRKMGVQDRGGAVSRVPVPVSVPRPVSMSGSEPR